MSNANMVIYNQEIQTTTIERLGQMIEAFNEASGMSLMLSADLVQGDYSKAAFWKSLSAAQRRVDRNAANASVGATNLEQGELVGVKVAGGFGPVLMEPAQLTWLARDPEEAIMAIAEGFAESLMQDQLNTAIASAVSAIENVAGAVNDVSGSTAITQGALNGSHAKFGDKSGMLVTQVMSGSTYHRLIDKALVNDAQLFTSENVTVVGILGKRIVVTDAPALFEAGVPNKEKVLTLTAGAVMVEGGNDIVSNMETSNGKDRIETTWQADYSFVVKLKGFAWDVTAGGSSPSDAEIGTGTNWDQAVTDVKNIAGVLAVGSADAA